MSPGAQQPRMKKMKAPAERRWRAPSLTLGKALGKGPSTKEGPSAGVDTCAFLSSFVCSNRTLLLEGPVELKRGRQRWERHLFLFNDMCVVAKVKYNNNFKMKNKIKLSDMWAAGCVDEAGDGNADAMRSFILGWPTVNFVATFSSPEQKDKWLSLLQRYISLEKEKDYPKSIPLKIFTKDMGNCAYSKVIIIKNSDTAKEVINMSLPMLRISGSERDYQLWVSSGKEAAPYPLTGHEYPYGIKMSHLRDTALLTQGSEDSTSPSKLRELFLMEQLPREMQCQFTLQPSLLAAAQQLSDSGPKTSKRRRSRIKWAFWQGASARLDNSPTSPTSPMPGQLFGASLPSICENDNLPKPVSDMLFFLNQEGPLTEGIFRLSASVKSCRELKEKLNSGAEVRLDCESIFVIASVLKDFLRNIPGSILSSDLCHHWVSVMDQGNDEEKINTIQRLLDQLPRANVVLLRYLFGVLHNIEQHSSSNKMTAFNLAVCIAPSILWPPNSSSPELENELIKKVTPLIQFLIENCCRIFGEEITSLFGKASAKCDTEEKASSISCLQVTDSSCDSLKKKLIADADAPCSDVLKDLGQASRSKASVLTLSDDDLNQPEVEGPLILRDIDLNCSKHEDIQMEPPPEYKPLTVTVVDTEPTLENHAGDPSCVLTVCDDDVNQPEVGGPLILRDFDLDSSKHEDIEMEPPPEYKPLTVTVVDTEPTLEDHARDPSCVLTICDDDVNQPEVGGLLILRDFDLHVSKHEGIEMEPPPEYKPLTVTVVDTEPTLEDHAGDPSCVLTVCDDDVNQPEVGGLLILREFDLDSSKHEDIEMEPPPEYKPLTVTVVDTEPTLEDHAGDPSCVLTICDDDVNQPEVGGLLILRDFDLDVSKHEDIEMEPPTEYKPLTVTVVDTEPTLEDHAGDPSCVLTICDDDVNQPEVGGLLILREFDLDSSKHEDIEMEPPPEYKPLTVTVVDTEPTLEDHAGDPSCVLTICDDDVNQPEVGGLLILRDFDLDVSKHEDIEMEPPTEYKPLTVTVVDTEPTLEDHAGDPSCVLTICDDDVNQPEVGGLLILREFDLDSSKHEDIEMEPPPEYKPLTVTVVDTEPTLEDHAGDPSCVLTICDDDVNQPEVGGLLILRDFDLHVSKHEGIEMEPPPEYKPLTVTVVDTEPTLEDHAGDPSCVLTVCDDDVNQPEVGGLLILREFDLDSSKHEDIEMEPPPEYKPLTVTVVDTEPTLEDHAGDPSCVLTVCDNDVNQPEVGGLLILRDFDLDVSKHEDIEMEPPTEYKPLTVTVVDTEPTLEDHAGDPSCVLTICDDDVNQPEVGGLLILRDFDLDASKHEDIQMEPPPEYKPLTVTAVDTEPTLEDHAGDPSCVLTICDDDINQPEVGGPLILRDFDLDVSKHEDIEMEPPPEYKPLTVTVVDTEPTLEDHAGDPSCVLTVCDDDVNQPEVGGLLILREFDLDSSKHEDIEMEPPPEYKPLTVTVVDTEPTLEDHAGDPSCVLTICDDDVNQPEVGGLLILRDFDLDVSKHEDIEMEPPTEYKPLTVTVVDTEPTLEDHAGDPSCVLTICDDDVNQPEVGGLLILRDFDLHVSKHEGIEMEPPPEYKPLTVTVVDTEPTLEDHAGDPSCVLTVCDDDVNQPEVGGLLILREFDLDSSKHEDIEMEPPPEYKPLTVTVVDTEPTLEDHAGDPSCVLTVCDNDVNQPEVGGLLILRDFDLDVSKHEDIEMEPPTEYKPLTVTVVDTEPTLEDHAGDPSCVLTICDDDVNQPEVGGLLILRDFDLHVSKHEGIEMEPPPEYKPLTVTVVDTEPTLEDHAGDPSCVLTVCDDDVNQPEVGGLLILRDFDLDASKHEDIQMEPPPEYKPLTVTAVDTEPTLEDHAGDPSCVLTICDDDINQPEVGGPLILRDFDLDVSKHEDIEMEPPPEYKPLTVTVVDTEPTLEDHAGDPSCVLTVCDDDVNQPEVGGLLILREFDLDSSKHEDIEMEPPTEYKPLTVTVVDTEPTLEDHAGDPSCVLTICDDDVNQPEVGGLLILRDFDLHVSKHEGIEMEPPPEYKPLTVTVVDTEPTLEDHAGDPSCVLTVCDDDVNQPEVGGLLILRDFDLDASKHEDIQMEPPPEYKPLTVTAVDTEPTLEDHAGDPSCVLTICDDDINQPEVGGPLILRDFDLDVSKHEDIEMEPPPEYKPLTVTVVDTEPTLEDHAGDPSCVLTVCDDDVNQPEVGGLLILREFDLDSSKHEDIEMEPPPEYKPLTVTVVDTEPTLEDHAGDPSCVLTVCDDDVNQPEVGGPLILRDFDLDVSKHEDIEMEPPPEYKPLTVAVLDKEPTLQEHAGDLSGMTEPSYPSTAAADAPKSLRQHQYPLESSTSYLDSKLSSLKQFYQKKLRKSRHGAVPSQKDEDHLKQKQPLQEEGTACFKESLVTGTDIKNSDIKKSAKKKSLFGNKGNHGKLLPRSKAGAISVASCSHMSPQDHPRSQPFGLDTSGTALPHTTGALKNSERQQLCSEPNIDVQPCKRSYLRRIFSKKQNKTDYASGHLHREEDHLKRQIEGQNLVNQSSVMGIEVDKSSATKQNTRCLPWRKNICLSCISTSPCDSSGSSQDSAFSQISEHSVCTPTETSSPIDCNFQAQSKPGELSSDFCSPSLISGVPGTSSGQTGSCLAYTNNDSVECHSQMHSVTLHPSMWLRNGLASLKTLSFKKKARAPRSEEKKLASQKESMEPPPCASGVLEANSLQENPKDMPLTATERVGAVLTGHQHSSCPNRDSEKHSRSPFSLLEDSLKLRMSHEEGKNSGQCSPGTPPCERSSPSSLIVDEVSSPDSGSAAVKDVGNKHSTKDI